MLTITATSAGFYWIGQFGIYDPDLIQHSDSGTGYWFYRDDGSSVWYSDLSYNSDSILILVVTQEQFVSGTDYLVTHTGLQYWRQDPVTGLTLIGTAEYPDLISDASYGSSGWGDPTLLNLYGQLGHEIADYANAYGLSFEGSTTTDYIHLDQSFYTHNGPSVINTYGGDDSAVGGSGNDIINLGDGNDTARGGNGNDTISGGADDDDIEGGFGNDELSGGDGNDILDGYYDDDVLHGGSGDDWLEGGRYDDGEDQLYGGDGNDRLYGGLGNDIMDGGDGDDFFQDAWETNGGDDTILGGAGNDHIVHRNGADHIDAGDDDDRVEISNVAASYTVIGGAGTDRLEINYVSNDTPGVVLDLTLANDQLLLPAGGIVQVSGFEQYETGGGNDTVRGTSAPEEFYGQSGNDYFYASLGDDFYDGGGTGSGSFSGLDTLDFSSFGLAVHVDGLTEEAWSGPGGTGTRLAHFRQIETVIGTAFADTFVASNEVDNVSAGGGNDTILASGGGNILDGGDGVDTLSYANSNAAVTVDLAANTASGGHATGDTISNFENVIGSAHADTLYGSSAGNVLNGGNGADTLDGRFGVDQMYGGGGNDIFYVDTYLDAVHEASGEGTFDQVYASATYALTGGAEVERLATTSQTGTAAITLIGNEFGQQMLGNNGNNVLAGGGGVDSFIGYGGNDIYVVDDAAEQITEVAGQGTDAVYTTVSYTLAAGLSIERLVAAPLASTNVVNLTGNELGQVIVGNNGVNTINGAAGNDSIYGMGGNDYIEGAEGNDSLYGGTGVDRFIFRESLGSASGIDRIYDMTSVDHIVIDALAVNGLTSLTANQFRLGTAAGDADDRIIYDATSGVFWFDPDGTGAQAAILFGVIDGAPAGVDHTWFELM